MRNNKYWATLYGKENYVAQFHFGTAPENYSTLTIKNGGLIIFKTKHEALIKAKKHALALNRKNETI